MNPLTILDNVLCTAIIVFCLYKVKTINDLMKDIDPLAEQTSIEEVTKYYKHKHIRDVFKYTFWLILSFRFAIFIVPYLVNRYGLKFTGELVMEIGLDVCFLFLLLPFIIRYWLANEAKKRIEGGTPVYTMKGPATIEYTNQIKRHSVICITLIVILRVILYILSYFKIL